MSSTPYRLPLALPRLRRAESEGALAGVCAGIAKSLRVDATLVRLILVPAAMEIMGRWNWWLPKRVDRLLPHAGFEGRSGREPALDLGA